MAKTVEQLVNAALRDAGVTLTGLGGNDIARQLLYRVLVEFWRDFGSYETSQTLTSATTPALVAGTGEYAIDTELDSIKAVMVRTGATGAYRPLPQVDYIEQYDYANNGTPGAWYLRRPAGARMLGLVPVPDASAVTNLQFLILYTTKPAEPTTDADTIPVTNEEAEFVTLQLAAKFADRVGEDTQAQNLREQARRVGGRTAETDMKLLKLALSNPYGDYALRGASLHPGQGLTEEAT